MRYLLTACLCSFFILLAFRSPVRFEVHGKITDENGSPIQGASIIIKGTNTGTTTYQDGSFKLIITAEKATLSIAYIGYNTKEVEVSATNNTITVSLVPAAQHLEEVLVTALGITKKKKQFGYSVSTIRGTQGTTPPVGIVNSLQGKAAGVNIKAPNKFFEIKKHPKKNDESDKHKDDLSREGYDAIIENRFLSVNNNPLSTFSIDVDAASYSNVRRMLTMGKLPPAGAVRIEEMINYFTYDYPEPKNEDPFSINTEIADCPWNTNHKLVLIGLQGKRITSENLPPSNMVFLIDVSGSMNAENKLPLVKQSVKLLVDQLRTEDKVAIVVYAGNAGLVLPSTSGDEKKKIKDAIDQLEAGGSTAGGAGIQLAYKVAKEGFIEEGNNRVLLCTDGDFNIGISSDDELERLIEEERESGIFLTVLGYGMGNYQDAKMQKLADKGNGNHAYIDTYNEARKILVNEFGGTLFTIAKDVKLQIEFNPANVQAYRLIGYENRMLNKEDFNNDKKDAGELGSGHTVTALYEVMPPGVKSDFIEPVDKLKYQPQPKLTAHSGSELLTIKFRYKKPDAFKSRLMEHIVVNNSLLPEATSTNFRFAAAVAEFGMLLRNSAFIQNSSYANVLQIASGALGTDREGYRSEFLKLIKNAESLALKTKGPEEDNTSKR